MTETIKHDLVLILRQLGAPPVGEEADLFATGAVKSMQLMELINQLEDRFGVRVEQRDIMTGRLRSVASIAALVADRRRP